MNIFEKWWYNTGSGITKKPNENWEEHTKRVCNYLYKYLKTNKNNTFLPDLTDTVCKCNKPIPDTLYGIYCSNCGEEICN